MILLGWNLTANNRSVETGGEQNITASSQRLERKDWMKIKSKI